MGEENWRSHIREIGSGEERIVQKNPINCMDNGEYTCRISLLFYNIKQKLYVPIYKALKPIWPVTIADLCKNRMKTEVPFFPEEGKNAFVAIKCLCISVRVPWNFPCHTLPVANHLYVDQSLE